MLNSPYQRAKRKEEALQAKQADQRFIITTMAVLLLTMAVLLISCQAQASTITETDAVRAILGEAESEPFIGQIALAEVIRTRGSMKGIYGFNAIKYKNGIYYRGNRAISRQMALQAIKAWKTSATTNYALKAQGWGNAADLKAFRKTRWFKKCYIVKTIGNHHFWKERT